MLQLKSLHHVHVQVRDLAGHQRFTEAFGLTPAGDAAGTTYYRTAGDAAYSLVAQQGDDTRLRAIAFNAESRQVLDRAVNEYGATAVRRLDGPGGGVAVSLKDPDGTTIDLVFGIEPRQPDPLRQPPVINYPSRRERFNHTHALPTHGPAQLLRLGHVGLFVGDFRRTTEWYGEVLGLVPSDRLFAGAPQNFIGGFYRLGRGAEWVDHHTMAIFAMGKPGVHHMSFEVCDIEQQMFAHRHLQKRGFEPVWGVGRHPLGSHVFDLWKDPNGLRFETFTDTDWCNDQRQCRDYPVQEAEMDHWSNDGHERYFA